MKSILTFIILSTIATISFANDESSHSSTILPGSYITLNKELILKANSDRIELGERLAMGQDGYRYMLTSCHLKVESAVAYDRKLSYGRTLAITKVITAGYNQKYMYFFLENNSYIECIEWKPKEKKISIADFRLLLSDSDIDLALNVPEL